MIQSCKLTKTGLMAIRWNAETKCSEAYPPTHALDILSLPCVVEEGVTLLNIFAAVENYPLVMAFMAPYSWCGQLPAFHEQIKQPWEKYEDFSGDEYLEIYRIGQVTTADGVDSLETSVDLHLIDPDSQICKFQSVTTLPLNTLALLPVCLDTNYAIYKGENRPCVEVNQGFTLLEVLHAIYYGISWYGGPEEKKQFCRENAEMSQGILEGKVETFPMEDD